MKQTQAQRLLHYLAGKTSDDGWVPAYLLPRISLSYTRRIYELRLQGHIIELKDEYFDGQRRTSYRLIKKT